MMGNLVFFPINTFVTPAKIKGIIKECGIICSYIKLNRQGIRRMNPTKKRIAVLTKLLSFLPVGIEPILIPDKRLLCVPPDLDDGS